MLRGDGGSGSVTTDELSDEAPTSQERGEREVRQSLDFFVASSKTGSGPGTWELLLLCPYYRRAFKLLESNGQMARPIADEGTLAESTALAAASAMVGICG